MAQVSSEIILVHAQSEPPLADDAPPRDQFKVFAVHARLGHQEKAGKFLSCYFQLAEFLSATSTLAGLEHLTVIGQVAGQ